MTILHVEKTQKATQRDNILWLLIQQMLEGWPKHRSLLMILKPFWQLKDDLTIEHSYITWSGRVSIPAVSISKYLQTLYNGHPGITKRQLRDCTSIYWPTINKVITNHIQSCVPCQPISNSQQKEQTIPLEVQESHGKHWELIYFYINVYDSF